MPLTVPTPWGSPSGLPWPLMLILVLLSQLKPQQSSHCPLQFLLESSEPGENLSRTHQALSGLNCLQDLQVLGQEHQ